MQSSFVNGLKTASRRKTRSSLIPAQPSLVASTSCTTVQWDQRRTAWFPTDWIRRTMSPQIREKDSEKEVEAARQQARERGEASLFEYEDVSSDAQAAIAKATGREVQGPVEHRGATKNFWISHRKLNKLAHQVAGKPIDSAILQMIFSEKRASGRIKSMLAQAKSSAVTRGMDSERLVVSEAWVNKGKGGRQMKRLEIKGRGRIGIRTRYNSKMVVMLREGLTFEEKRQKDREARLKRIVSSGLNREDVPLRNPSSQWAW